MVEEIRDQLFSEFDAAIEDNSEFFDEMVHDVAEMEMAQEIVDSVE